MIPLRIKYDVKTAVRKIKAVPKRLAKATFIELEAAADKVKRAMQVPGRKVKYPIKWDSDKQRKAFFASDGFGAGIPTKRTQKYINGWLIRNKTDGYELTNREPYSMFISGTATGRLADAVHVTKTGQSHIHEGRWKLLAPTVLNVVKRLPKRILETFRIKAVDA